MEEGVAMWCQKAPFRSTQTDLTPPQPSANTDPSNCCLAGGHQIGASPGHSDWVADLDAFEDHSIETPVAPSLHGIEEG